MEKFYIRLADKVIAVTANYKETKMFCGEFLIEEPEQADFEVNVTLDEMNKFRAILQKRGIESFGEKYLERITLQKLINEELSKYHVVTFHSSAIMVDQEAYLFTAPSGTGKSTHARLWRKLLGERAVMINDDKPMLRLDEDGGVTVFGTPWNGKHGLGSNVSAPLKCVCMLSQSPENRIEPQREKERFHTLFVQTYMSMSMQEMDAVSMKRIMEVMEGIANKPMWHLECNISEDAARLSYETMSGKKVEE